MYGQGRVRPTYSIHSRSIVDAWPNLRRVDIELPKKAIPSIHHHDAPSIPTAALSVIFFRCLWLSCPRQVSVTHRTVIDYLGHVQWLDTI